MVDLGLYNIYKHFSIFLVVFSFNHGTDVGSPKVTLVIKLVGAFESMEFLILPLDGKLISILSIVLPLLLCLDV